MTTDVPAYFHTGYFAAALPFQLTYPALKTYAVLFQNGFVFYDSCFCLSA
jgi:hypothetical protein